MTDNTTTLAPAVHHAIAEHGYRPASWDVPNHIDIPNTILYAAIRAEAYAEQVNRDHTEALREQNYRLAHPGAVGVIADLPHEDDAADRVATALGANPAQLAKLREIISARKTAEAEAEALRGEVERQRALLASNYQLVEDLNNEQITDGRDPRLVDFWTMTAQAADDAGYCPEYDRIAEAMNGLTRDEIKARNARPGTVTVTVTVSVKDIDDWNKDTIDEQVRDYLRNENADDYQVNED